MMPPSTLRDRIRAAAPPVGVAVVLLVLLTSQGAAQSLRGSPASVELQYRMAREHDFSFLATASKVYEYVEKGRLVRAGSSGDVQMNAVSYPFVRPEVELFIRRLGSQYRNACGERLVVTSLTRPLNRQPRNASDRSVHPTGMAVDLRYSRSSRCRKWLEGVLLGLEKAGVVEATRERFPPHYHVAVFPRQYLAHVERLERRQGGRVATAPALAYRVRSGDTLWAIARAHRTTVDDLRDRNNLRGSRIVAGQLLEVPAR